MVSCTEVILQEELRAVIQSIQLQDNGQANWISSFTYDPSVLHDGVLKPTLNTIQTRDIADVRQAHIDDPATVKVYQFVHSTEHGQQPRRLQANRLMLCYTSSSRLTQVVHWQRWRFTA